MKKNMPGGGEGELLEKIEALQKQLTLALADYRNLEMRIHKEAAQFREKFSWNLIDKLLAVLDDLELAERHLQDRGLTMAVEQFKKVLASEGVEQIETEDEEFDPVKMDCVAVVAGPKNRVVATLQPGYTINGKVIRPAKVKVGKGGQK